MTKPHFSATTGSSDNVTPMRRGGSGGGDMEIERRITGIETAQIQLGMDMQYIKGRIEDMPTKDFIHGRLSAYFAGIGALVLIGLTVIGFLITK